MKVLATILAIVLLPAIAFAENYSINNPKRVSFENCDFEIFFPSETENQPYEYGGYQGNSVQSAWDGGRTSAFMKAECAPFVISRGQIKGVAKQRGQDLGLGNFELRVDEDGALPTAHYSGFKHAGGHRLRIIGRVIAGPSSLLDIFTIEPAKGAPSSESVFFHNAYRLR